MISALRINLSLWFTFSCFQPSNMPRQLPHGTAHRPSLHRIGREPLPRSLHQPQHLAISQSPSLHSRVQSSNQFNATSDDCLVAVTCASHSWLWPSVLFPLQAAPPHFAGVRDRWQLLTLRAVPHADPWQWEFPWCCCFYNSQLQRFLLSSIPRPRYSIPPAALTRFCCLQTAQCSLVDCLSSS